MILALRIALRELRGGVRDFRLFLGCLVIGVAVIAGITSLSDHIDAGIRNESRTLLGGDVEIRMVNVRATEEQLAFLKGYGRVAMTTRQRAMAIAGDNTALVEIKGVDAQYPMLGEAVLASGLPLHNVLASGSIVVEDALLLRLEKNIKDEITLGVSPFAIADVVTKEPDRIANPLSLGLRVIARIDDLESRGFLLPAGLIRYNYHVLLDDRTQLDAFTAALAARFPDAPWVIRTTNNNNRGVQNFIERLQLFLTLAGLATLLIGGVGIMNAAETYLKRQSETIAIMKTLGASRNLVFGTYVLVLLLITLAGTLAGAALGMVIAQWSLPFLAGLLPVFDTRFSWDMYALLLAIGFGVLTVFTFSIAALGRGVEIKPAALFRGLEPASARLSSGKLAANTALAGLLIAMLVATASDRAIAIGFILSALAGFLIFYLITLLIKTLARKARLRTPWMRLAIANLHRPGSHTFSIILSTGIGLTVLITLLLVEGNFQREVNETMPARAPSLFLIDIQPSQKEAFLIFLGAHDYVSGIAIQPMVRGRIIKLNHVPIKQIAVDRDVRWAADHDRGLTWAATPPDNANVVEGRWWPADYRGKPLISLDRKVARGMGVSIGDTMTLNILGQEVEAEIANLRDVNYISFQINFAMILSPGIIEQFPASYIATLRADTPENELALIRETAKRFPNISSIRLKDSIDQIRGVVEDIAAALHVTAAVTLFSGILVLASALAATLDQRTYDTVVLKVLGARRADIVRMFLAEWLLLASVTALISCLLGSAGAWLILKRFDWVAFQLIPGAVAETVVLALAFITVTGFAIHTRIFRTKAASILRNE